MKRERLHRPELGPTHPYRDFARRRGAASELPPDPDAEFDDGPQDGEGGFIDEGVRAAYSVMDAYLRQGRRVARQIGRYSRPAVMSGGHRRELQARWLQLTSELAANWFDLLGLVTESLLPGRDGDDWEDEAEAEHYAPDPARSSPVKVAYEIKSARRVLVELEFHPGRATTRLASHPLRTLEPSNGAIDILFEARGDRKVVVKVTVPDEQPPGLYTGILLDADNGHAVGTIGLDLR